MRAGQEAHMRKIMGMNNPEARRRLLEMMHMVRQRSNSDSAASRILARFYPAGVLGSRDIWDGGDTYRIITRLAANGYIQRIDSQDSAPAYVITIMGKIRVLCGIFGVRFLSLCALVEAYVLHKQAKDGCASRYPIAGLDRMFGDVYSGKTIRNSAYLLSETGLACPGPACTICVSDEALERLAPHDEILEEIHVWIAGIRPSFDDMALDKPADDMAGALDNRMFEPAPSGPGQFLPV